MLYQIINENGIYFAGHVCGCDVFKDHHTRGAYYNTAVDASKDCQFYLLAGCRIIEAEE